MRWAIPYMRCRKAAPPKIPETDPIFEQLAQVNAQADADETVLRLSLDAKLAFEWVIIRVGGVLG
jgi:hypothetical protein